MNTRLKTVLLTLIALSLVSLAIIEMTGISSRALFNKYGIGPEPAHTLERAERDQREAELKGMPRTAIYFYEESYDFGKVKEGDKVSHVYKFKNIGEHPLLIADVIASCGCTVPSFPKEPIKPGDEGEIKVEFNSSGRKGKNHKSIMVISNTEREKRAISFDAQVE